MACQFVHSSSFKGKVMFLQFSTNFRTVPKSEQCSRNYWSAAGNLSDRLNFFAGQNENLLARKKYLGSVIKLISTDFNNQFAKTLVLMYSESKRKWKLNHHFKCFSLFLFCFFFRENSVTVNGNTEWFPLGWPYWICSFWPFRIHSKYLKKKTVKDRYNCGKSLR